MPIIVVTSRDSDVDELMSMNFGADDFITKPYNTQILLAHIAAILNRTYQAQSEMSHEYAGLLVNMSKGTASYQGKEAALTKNELRILDLLMRNQTSITQRDDIMEALWQSNEFIDDNTLTVNINRLRKSWKQSALLIILKQKRAGVQFMRLSDFIKSKAASIAIFSLLTVLWRCCCGFTA